MTWCVLDVVPALCLGLSETPPRSLPAWGAVSSQTANLGNAKTIEVDASSVATHSRRPNGERGTASYPGKPGSDGALPDAFW